jgi:hypothetical protein
LNTSWLGFDDHRPQSQWGIVPMPAANSAAAAASNMQTRSNRMVFHAARGSGRVGPGYPFRLSFMTILRLCGINLGPHRSSDIGLANDVNRRGIQTNRAVARLSRICAGRAATPTKCFAPHTTTPSLQRELPPSPVGPSTGMSIRPKSFTSTLERSGTPSEEAVRRPSEQSIVLDRLSLFHT